MPANHLTMLAEGLLPVVLAAGRLQLAYQRAGVTAITKADGSPVTAADHESETLILAALQRLAPGVPVVSEEAAAAGHMPSVGASFFLVDPLDGTKPYLRREPQFTLNIAFIEDGSPVMGIVYAPALSELYVATAPGEAAMARLAPASAVTALADCGLQPIRTRTPDPDRLTAIVSKQHMDEVTERFLGRYPIAERQAMSSSLKFCLIARGEADVYPRAGPTSEWDTAAGHAVLVAAGGAVVALDGQAPLRYGKPRFRNAGFVAWGRLRSGDEPPRAREP